MSWIDRAVNLSEIAKDKGAPADIRGKASEAIQAFLTAKDYRHCAYLGCDGFGAKADRQHRIGKKYFREVREWIDLNATE